VTIPFNATLGCGGCIKGGYIYCIPGAEGSDPASWGSSKAICCKDNNTCPALSNNTYNCSNKYTSPILAKAMCPFRKASCGNNSAFGFDNTGESQSITINLTEGETCTYMVQTMCGVPSVEVAESSANFSAVGMLMEMVDFDQDDLNMTSSNSTTMSQGGNHQMSGMQMGGMQGGNQSGNHQHNGQGGQGSMRTEFGMDKKP
jgi:hypothetical protein